MPRVIIFLILTTVCSAADSIGWRGDGSGRFASTVPTGFEPSWMVPLASTCSSPVVIGDRVITLAEPNRVICLDAASGAERWAVALTGAGCCNEAQQAWLAEAAMTPRKDKAAWKQLGKQAGAVFPEKLGKPSEHGSTAATPVSDGIHLWVHWGPGFISCLDLAAGTLVWEAGFPTGQLPELAHDSSPVLLDGRLLIMGSSRIHALDAASGAVLWTAEVAKMGHGSATPVVIEQDGAQVIVTPSGTVLDRDGAVLSQFAVMGDQSPAPYAGGVVVASGDGYGRNPQFLECFSLADPSAPTSLWTTDDRRDAGGSTSTMSPLVAAGQVFMIDKSKQACWIYDQQSGEPATAPVAIDGKVPGHTWRPSPAAAANAIIVPIYTGAVLLLAPDGSGTILGRYESPAPISGSPFCAGGHLYLRSHAALIRF